jgi:hypothetical protein
MRIQHLAILFIASFFGQATHLVFATPEEGNGANFPPPDKPKQAPRESFFVSPLSMSIADTFAPEGINEAEYSKAACLFSQKGFLDFQKKLSKYKAASSQSEVDKDNRMVDWASSVVSGLTDFHSKNTQSILREGATANNFNLPLFSKGLTSVFIDNLSPSNERLRIFTKGTSQAVVFRRSDQRKQSPYLPIYISNSASTPNEAHFLTQLDSEIHPTMLKVGRANPSSDSIAAEADDIVLIFSDGVLDNFYLSFITVFLNVYLKNATLKKTIVKKNLKGANSSTTTDSITEMKEILKDYFDFVTERTYDDNAKTQNQAPKKSTVNFYQRPSTTKPSSDIHDQKATAEGKPNQLPVTKKSTANKPEPKVNNFMTQEKVIVPDRKKVTIGVKNDPVKNKPSSNLAGSQLNTSSISNVAKKSTVGLNARPAEKLPSNALRASTTKTVVTTNPGASLLKNKVELNKPSQPIGARPSFIGRGLPKPVETKNQLTSIISQNQGVLPQTQSIIKGNAKLTSFLPAKNNQQQPQRNGPIKAFPIPEMNQGMAVSNGALLSRSKKQGPAPVTSKLLVQKKPEGIQNYFTKENASLNIPNDESMLLDDSLLLDGIEVAEAPNNRKGGINMSDTNLLDSVVFDEESLLLSNSNSINEFLPSEEQQNLNFSFGKQPPVSNNLLPKIKPLVIDDFSANQIERRSTPKFKKIDSDKKGLPTFGRGQFEEDNVLPDDIWSNDDKKLDLSFKIPNQVNNGLDNIPGAQNLPFDFNGSFAEEKPPNLDDTFGSLNLSMNSINQNEAAGDDPDVHSNLLDLLEKHESLDGPVVRSNNMQNSSKANKSTTLTSNLLDKPRSDQLKGRILMSTNNFFEAFTVKDISEVKTKNSQSLISPAITKKLMVEFQFDSKNVEDFRTKFNPIDFVNTMHLAIRKFLFTTSKNQKPFPLFDLAKDLGFTDLVSKNGKSDELTILAGMIVADNNAKNAIDQLNAAEQQLEKEIEFFKSKFPKANFEIELPNEEEEDNLMESVNRELANGSFGYGDKTGVAMNGFV